MTRSFNLRIEGLDEVQRALARLPEDIQREMDQTTRELAQLLASLVRGAGEADSRQSARAASTVRADTSGGTPAVVVGPHPLLFGSEFGAFGRYGWYADDRYKRSRSRQFRPHLGGGSYWFFSTAEEHQGDIDIAWREAADAVIRSWGA